MTTTPLRVMLVDDSAIYRRLTWESLSAMPNIELVGSASNGQLAIDLLPKLRPDLLLLDLEMPILDGIEVLRHLSNTSASAGAIMLASNSTASARKTTEALSLGAFDFVLKPAGGSPSESAQRLRDELGPRLDAFAASRHNPTQHSSTQRASASDAERTPGARWTAPVARLEPVRSQIEVVAIGVSTGGPAALATLLPSLPGDLPVPIVIVQHMPAKFTTTLAESLNRQSQLSVHEASHGMRVEPGNVYIAPGGQQMKIRRNGTSSIISVNDDAPERNCKPSVDYMMRSVAQVWGNKALGVMLTGMGDDGTEGFRMLDAQGAPLLIQDEASCVVFGMPGSVLRAGLSPEVAPLAELGGRICQFAGAVPCH